METKEMLEFVMNWAKRKSSGAYFGVELDIENKIAISGSREAGSRIKVAIKGDKIVVEDYNYAGGWDTYDEYEISFFLEEKEDDDKYQEILDRIEAEEDNLYDFLNGKYQECLTDHNSSLFHIGDDYKIPKLLLELKTKILSKPYHVVGETQDGKKILKGNVVLWENDGNYPYEDEIRSMSMLDFPKSTYYIAS